jgi:hypothetical protein
LLADCTVPAASQFCDGLCNCCNDFVRVNRVWLVGCHRILGKKIIDQFDHHAMQARSFLIISLVWHETLPLEQVGVRLVRAVHFTERSELKVMAAVEVAAA